MCGGASWRRWCCLVRPGACQGSVTAQREGPDPRLGPPRPPVWQLLTFGAAPLPCTQRCWPLDFCSASASSSQAWYQTSRRAGRRAGRAPASKGIGPVRREPALQLALHKGGTAQGRIPEWDGPAASSGYQLGMLPLSWYGCPHLPACHPPTLHHHICTNLCPAGSLPRPRVPVDSRRAK